MQYDRTVAIVTAASVICIGFVIIIKLLQKYFSEIIRRKKLRVVILQNINYIEDFTNSNNISLQQLEQEVKSAPKWVSEDVLVYSRQVRSELGQIPEVIKDVDDLIILNDLDAAWKLVEKVLNKLQRHVENNLLKARKVMDDFYELAVVVDTCIDDVENNIFDINILLLQVQNKGFKFKGLNLELWINQLESLKSLSDTNPVGKENDIKEICEIATKLLEKVQMAHKNVAIAINSKEKFDKLIPSLQKQSLDIFCRYSDMEVIMDAIKVENPVNVWMSVYVKYKLIIDSLNKANLSILDVFRVGSMRQQRFADALRYAIEIKEQIDGDDAVLDSVMNLQNDILEAKKEHKTLLSDTKERVEIAEQLAIKCGGRSDMRMYSDEAAEELTKAYGILNRELIDWVNVKNILNKSIKLAMLVIEDASSKRV